MNRARRVRKVDLLLIIVVVILIVLLAALAPLGLIWALNTLFSLGIAYAFKTWLAAFVLLLVVLPHDARVHREK